MNNELNPSIALVKVGSPSADLTIPAMCLVKKSKILSVKIMNGAGIAASNTDFAVISLKAGSTTVASYDTRAAGQGALTANVSKAFAIVSGEETQVAGTDLTLVYDETDSGTAVALTDAVVQIEYFPL